VTTRLSFKLDMLSGKCGHNKFSVTYYTNQIDNRVKKLNCSFKKRHTSSASAARSASAWSCSASAVFSSSICRCFDSRSSWTFFNFSKRSATCFSSISFWTSFSSLFVTCSSGFTWKSKRRSMAINVVSVTGHYKLHYTWTILIEVEIGSLIPRQYNH